jgi:hypothetical protein
MATITNIAKAVAITLTNAARNSATLTNATRSGGTIATAGLYYGFGAFTYAGGEALVSGSSVSITNLAKS